MSDKKRGPVGYKTYQEAKTRIKELEAELSTLKAAWEGNIDTLKAGLRNRDAEIATLKARIKELTGSLQVLHDVMKMGGFDCYELDEAAALLTESGE